MPRAVFDVLGAMGGRTLHGREVLMDLASWNLTSVCGGPLVGEAVIEVLSSDTLAFARPPELRACGAIKVLTPPTVEGVRRAVAEQHAAFRARRAADIAALARLGFASRITPREPWASVKIDGSPPIEFVVDADGNVAVTVVGGRPVERSRGRVMALAEAGPGFVDAVRRTARVLLSANAPGTTGDRGPAGAAPSPAHVSSAQVESDVSERTRAVSFDDKTRPFPNAQLEELVGALRAEASDGMETAASPRRQAVGREPHSDPFDGDDRLRGMHVPEVSLEPEELATSIDLPLARVTDPQLGHDLSVPAAFGPPLYEEADAVVLVADTGQHVAVAADSADDMSPAIADARVALGHLHIDDPIALERVAASLESLAVRLRTRARAVLASHAAGDPVPSSESGLVLDTAFAALRLAPLSQEQQRSSSVSASGVFQRVRGADGGAGGMAGIAPPLDGSTTRPSPRRSPEASTQVERDIPADRMRAARDVTLCLVLGDAALRERMKRQLAARFRFVVDAENAQAARLRSVPGGIDVFVVVSPPVDQDTLKSLAMLTTTHRAMPPLVLVISSDPRFDSVSGVSLRLPPGKRFAEVVRQVIAGLARLKIRVPPA